MPVETAADRLVFLAAADFGCTVTYQSIGGGAAVAGLAAIFDNDYLAHEGEVETGVMTRSPRLTLRSADLVGEGRQGDLLTITAAPSQPEQAGRQYRVVQPRPDGTGLTVLFLEKV